MTLEKNLHYARELIMRMQPDEFGNVPVDIHQDRGIRFSVGREPLKTKETFYVSYQPPFGISKINVAIPIKMDQSEEGFRGDVEDAVKSIRTYLKPVPFDYHKQRQATVATVEKMKSEGFKSISSKLASHLSNLKRLMGKE